MTTVDTKKRKFIEINDSEDTDDDTREILCGCKKNCKTGYCLCKRSGKQCGDKCSCSEICCNGKRKKVSFSDSSMNLSINSGSDILSNVSSPPFWSIAKTEEKEEVKKEVKKSPEKSHILTILFSTKTKYIDKLTSFLRENNGKLLEIKASCNGLKNNPERLSVNINIQHPELKKFVLLLFEIEGILLKTSNNRFTD